MNIHAPRRGYALFAWALAFVAVLHAVPARARDALPKWPLIGPLQTRNLSPFSLLRMDFMPPPAAAGQRPGWDLDARLTHANSFVKSENVKNYLRARGQPRTLTAQDVQALLATPGDVLYFDGEITALDLTARYVHDRHWTGYVNLPLLFYGGGILDDAIDGFHQAFGFTSAERDLVADNEYQAVIRHSGDTLVLLDAPSGVQVGDPVLGVRFASEFANEAFAIIEGAVKLPVGDADNYVSSGAVDYGLQLTLQKQLGRHGLYLSVAHQWLGEAKRFPNAFRSQASEASVAYEFGFTRHTATVLQTSWSKTAFKTGSGPFATDELLASLGVRHWRGNVAYDFSITRNYGNYENTQDIAATLGVSWLLPGNPVNPPIN
ncbi:MAG: DUF3187 family protein [Gammaproteobacteria bacterium]|nr:DUF3187 family protein [Gammaproteobacteria bacterium]